MRNINKAQWKRSQVRGIARTKKGQRQVFVQDLKKPGSPKWVDVTVLGMRKPNKK